MLAIAMFFYALKPVLRAQRKRALARIRPACRRPAGGTPRPPPFATSLILSKMIYLLKLKVIEEMVFLLLAPTFFPLS